MSVRSPTLNSGPIHRATSHELGWKEELIWKLQDGLEKLYRSPNHGLADGEASEELRLPEGVERTKESMILNMVESGSYWKGGRRRMAKDFECSPRHFQKTVKRFRVSPNNQRHPCYVGVCIHKINNIKSEDALFDVRVRLSLLFEFDLVGAGFEKWVDAGHESHLGYLPLLAHQFEMLCDLGIMIPKLAFLNAISQQDVRPVEIRVYPRPERSKLECITWSQMWDIQFRQQFDLRDFPFDRQDLVLELSMVDFEPAHIMDRFHLVVYAVQYKQEMLDLPEWEVHRPKIQRCLPLHRRMNIHIPVSRQPQYYFWNIVFVVFMISTLGFTVFTESWENTSERVSIVLTLLLTNITFQYNVSSQLPKLCYFTMLDGYTFRMTVSLFLLAMGCCAAKGQQYLISAISHLDSLDFIRERVEEITPDAVDLLVTFIFGVLYFSLQIQWICVVLRNRFRVSHDTLRKKHFETSGNAPSQKEKFGFGSWLCFLFSYPFFLDAPKDGRRQSLPLEFKRSIAGKVFDQGREWKESLLSRRETSDDAQACEDKVEKPPTPHITYPKTPAITPNCSPNGNLFVHPRSPSRSCSTLMLESDAPMVRRGTKFSTCEPGTLCNSIPDSDAPMVRRGTKFSTCESGTVCNAIPDSDAPMVRRGTKFSTCETGGPGSADPVERGRSSKSLTRFLKDEGFDPESDGRSSKSLTRFFKDEFGHPRSDDHAVRDRKHSPKFGELWRSHATRSSDVFNSEDPAVGG